MKELIKIQSQLKVPKNQYNKFGKYNYRSFEDILEAVKPIANELNCYVKCSDELLQIGDRYYIKATASLISDAGEVESAVGFAREDGDKKGMDAMQLSGATSSYARKYALNGLFGIDDSKDADYYNEHNNNKNIVKDRQNTDTNSDFNPERVKAYFNNLFEKGGTPATEKQLKLLHILLNKYGCKEVIYKFLSIETSKDLPQGIVSKLIEMLNRENISEILEKIEIYNEKN